jgi:hypothetical protein
MDKLLTLNAVYFLLLGLFGVFMHAERAWEDGRIEKLFDWFIINPKATVKATTTSFGLIIAAIASGNLISVTDPVQVVAAFMLTYGCDSYFNNVNPPKKEAQ